MNSSIHLQRLVKWTVPAVTFVIAFFWYKRRRIDKAEDQCNDPGGVAKLSHEEETILSDTKEIDTSLHDSSTNYHCTQQEEPSHVPRKISESTDTSIKNCTSQSFCHRSHKYMDLETTSSMNGELGSNSSANFEIVSDRNEISFDSCSNADYTPVYKDVTNEKETVQCETEPYQQECAADNYGKDKKQTEKNTEDTAKTERGEAEERDSANHSPLSGALEGSVTDEARSEGSTDSGKGGSINGCKKEIITLSIYDFAIPQHLVGRLIGRHGSFLHNIRTKAGVDIYVNDHPCDSDYKICSIQGSVETIQVALKIIRQKFPEKKFPQMTLEDISTVESVVKAKVNENVTFDIPCTSSLSLCECVNNDINICHIVKPNWLFVQLTTHPTHHLLQNLEEDMTYWYNNIQMQPELMQQSMMNNGIEKGTFVAVHWDEKWVRGCIEIVDPLGEANIVRLIDHGGYWKFSNEKVKPIRIDCLQLPFQAIEIFLANIQPKDGVWSQEAYNLVHAICNSSGIALAQIAGRIDNNVYTNIYFRIINYGVISLADELIANGHANHVPMEQMQPETIEAICT